MLFVSCSWGIHAESKTDLPQGENKVYYIISFNHAVADSASYKLTNIKEILAGFNVLILLIDPVLDRERLCLLKWIMEISIGENKNHIEANSKWIDFRMVKTFQITKA